MLMLSACFVAVPEGEDAYAKSSTDAGTRADGGAAVGAGEVSSTCTPPPTGIVSWWTGDDTFADWMSRNPGSAVGSITFAPGMVGRAFVLDGSGAVSATTDGFPMGASDRTVEFWVQAFEYGSPSHSEMFFSYGALGAATGAYALFLWGSPSVVFSQWGQSFSGGTMNLRTWTHLAAVTSGSTTTIYVNGTPVTAQALPMATQAGRALLGGGGAAPDGTTHRLVGLLDEVTIYDRALSAAEIARIVAAGSAGKCKR
jgi:hypothetical protein